MDTNLQVICNNAGNELCIINFATNIYNVIIVVQMPPDASSALRRCVYLRKDPIDSKWYYTFKNDLSVMDEGGLNNLPEAANIITQLNAHDATTPLPVLLAAQIAFCTASNHSNNTFMESLEKYVSPSSFKFRLSDGSNFNDLPNVKLKYTEAYAWNDVTNAITYDIAKARTIKMQELKNLRINRWREMGLPSNPPDQLIDLYDSVSQDYLDLVAMRDIGTAEDLTVYTDLDTLDAYIPTYLQT